MVLKVSASCVENGLKNQQFCVVVAFIVVCDMSIRFRSIWSAMRRDAPLEEVLALINVAENEAFECHRTRDCTVVSHPHLLGAALAYHVHAAVVRRIVNRTTDMFVFSECLPDLTRLHCTRDVVNAVLSCVTVDDQDVDLKTWLIYTLTHEKRAWFWDQSVAGRFLQHVYRIDVDIQKRVIRLIANMHCDSVRVIRDLLDLPENTQ